MTSTYSEKFEKLFESEVCDLEFNEIDDIPDDPPLQPLNVRECHLCADKEAVVTLDCGDQLLCVDCFKKYARTNSGSVARKFDSSGYPVITDDCPLKCPYCRMDVKFYILARR